MGTDNRAVIAGEKSDYSANFKDFVNITGRGESY